MQKIAQGFSRALSDKLQKRKSIALADYLMNGGRQAAYGAFHGLAKRVRSMVPGPGWRRHPLRTA